MNILSKIIEAKKTRLMAAKALKPFAAVRDEALEVRRHAEKNKFAKSVGQPNSVNIIAEIKRRSPSKGQLKFDASAGAMARHYEEGGAVAISVLTEEDYFDGSLKDLESVKSISELPVLRKDFIFDDYQVYESAACGADALLLIVAALDDESLLRLRRITEEEMGMDALIEVHNAAEMERASKAGAKVIGVNNRNLSTFEVSLDVSSQLASLAPEGALLISESGIGSPKDVLGLYQLGYRGFLIGETFMLAADPEATLREFRNHALAPAAK
jgi:indole-3-glycerol phosphate synthase